MTASPSRHRLAQCHPERACLDLWFPQWEKESPRWTSSFPSIDGRFPQDPPWVLPHPGNLGGWTMGESHIDEEEGAA